MLSYSHWYIDVGRMTSLVVYMYSITPYYLMVKWETAQWTVGTQCASVPFQLLNTVLITWSFSEKVVSGQKTSKILSAYEKLPLSEIP